MAKEEIEYRVNEFYKSTAPASMRLDYNSVEIEFNVDLMSGITIIRNQMQTFDTQFYFTLERYQPVLMLLYQLKSTSRFIQKQSVIVPELHHSINYLPVFESGFLSQKNTLSQSMCIKIEPELVTNKWLNQCPLEEDWVRMLNGSQSYMTLHESKRMGSEILGALDQLANCPYKGQMGIFFKESLIQLLFIHQMAVFTKDSRKMSPETGKLSRRDVDLLHDVKDYLEVNFLDDMSLDMIIKQFGLNSFKLKYGFKTLFNTSVMRFIDDKKMAYARQILLDRCDYDMLDIADKLGYNHYSNFSLAFKRRFGYAPTHVKEMMA